VDGIKDQIHAANGAVFVSESEGGTELPIETAYSSVGSLIDANYFTGRMPWFGVSSIGVPLTAVVDMETGIILASEVDGPLLTTTQIVTLVEEANAD
jgi:hypothetical protein